MVVAAYLGSCNQKGTDDASRILFGLADDNNPTSTDTGTTTTTTEAQPGITVTDPSTGYVISEFYGSVTATVVLNKQPTADVTFTTASSDTTEATVSTESITFTKDNWDTAQSIVISGVDDYIKDGNQDISLIFGSVVSSDSGYSGKTIDNRSVTVLDNETYSISVSPRTFTTTEAAGTSHTAEYYVMLSAPPPHGDYRFHTFYRKRGYFGRDRFALQSDLYPRELEHPPESNHHGGG